MKKLLSVAILSLIGVSSLNSCKKADPDPLANWTCVCFNIYGTATSAVFDTVIIHEDKVEKSTATTFCNNTQASYDSTLNTVSHCTLH